MFNGPKGLFNILLGDGDRVLTEIENMLEKAKSNGHEIWVSGPAKAHAISELEDQIGRPLPNSLKNFLQKFGGLGIYDNFISGVLSDNPLEMSGGYIYADTKFLRDDYPDLPGSFWVLKKHEDGAYCLDVESPTFGDEYAIVNFDHGSSSQATRDFESFVKDVFLYEWSDVFD